MRLDYCLFLCAIVSETLFVVLLVIRYQIFIGDVLGF